MKSPSASSLDRPPIRSVSDILQLETLNQPGCPTLAELFERLYAARFQGPVVLHFAGGLPRNAEFPQPIQLPLDTGPRKP